MSGYVESLVSHEIIIPLCRGRAEPKELLL